MGTGGSDLDLEIFDERVLRSIIRGGLAVTGEALFRSTATELAKLFAARCVIAGAIGLEDERRIRSIVTYVDGQFAPDLDHGLAHTAWAELLAGGDLDVAHGARARFPDDTWLAAVRADAVLGVPLVSEGQIIGVIAVIDATTDRRSAEARGILTMFARGVAAEISRLRHERIERERANAALSHRSALLALAHMDKSDLRASLQTIVKTNAITLGVERVSYWTLSEDRSQITCEELYQCSTGEFQRGTVLRARDVPSYFEAVLSNVAIVAGDARTDPRTSEFTTGYFIPHGITSMLDIPVWRHGRIAGVLCHEHVGPMRTWRDEESDFATSAAGMCSVALEASDRHRAEERYELIARATNDVLWDWNLDVDQLTWNAGIHTVLRFPSGPIEPTIEWWHQQIHADERDAVLASLRAAIAGTARIWEVEYRFVRGDGTTAWITDRGFIVRDPQGRGTRMVGAMVDITERKEIEARLMVADRMASIGTLAAGVAHEINNPLAYIIANIDFALEGLRPIATSNELAESLNEAREGAIRVRTIVRDLRAFSRGEIEVYGPVDLRRMIEASINMAWNEIRHRARLVKDYGPPSFVQANEARLGQVVINLLVNAAQAIPEGAADDNEIRIVTGIDARGHAFLEVRDTGPGIPEAIRDRVFDPFYTTKSVGHGTGLGLSICHSIVSGLGGEITISDAPGHGCVMRVALPQAPRPAATPSTPPALPAPAAVTRHVVLVVDDDVRVGTAIQRLLKADWEVGVVTSARAAIELLDRGDRFDVILCDLMMPDMTGMDLHVELVRLHPALADRTVFMTGGTFTERAQEFLARVPNARLDKPFDRATLARTLTAAASRTRSTPT